MVSKMSTGRNFKVNDQNSLKGRLIEKWKNTTYVAGINVERAELFPGIQNELFR